MSSPLQMRSGHEVQGPTLRRVVTYVLLRRDGPFSERTKIVTRMSKIHTGLGSYILSRRGQIQGVLSPFFVIQT